ncbi:MAG: HelD family protein [Mycobacteriaceae bacterium]
MLYSRLDALRVTAVNRLSAVLLEKGGTPQARSERESYTQLYSEDIAKYDAAENGLCFGRIDLQDGEIRHVGRLGILNDSGEYEALLLDWRAPMARPFYLATPVAPENVLRRRHIRTRSRTVTRLNDEYLDLAAAAGRELSSSGDVVSESALLTALNAARTGQMNDIVETIQSEQDRIIRSEHKSILAVQGGPGTGKTAVALHRAAYLLYTYRQQLAKSGVLIVGPNDTFLKYIEQVLPSLGETGVILSTIGDLYPGIKAHVTDLPDTNMIKGSLVMTEVLKKAVRNCQEVPRSPIELTFDSHTLWLDRTIITRARGRARSSRKPHNLARPIFIHSAIDALTDQLVSTLGKNLVDGTNLLSREDVSDIRDELQEDHKILQALNKLWPELSPTQLLTDLFSSPKKIADAAPQLSEAEKNALYRKNHSGFSSADAPLLDELAELLGVDDEAEQQRVQRQWRQQILDAQGALDILTGSAPQDLEDELDPELLMAYDLIDAEQLAARHHHTEHLSTAERAARDRKWTYGHVIVDEAQELSAMAWRMLMRRIPNRWMTLVGDTAQTGDPAGTNSWKEVLEPYVAQRWKLTELTVNYRTPVEIMTIAQQVLNQINSNIIAPRSIRESGAAPWAKKIDAKNTELEVRSALNNLPTEGLRAVLACRNTIAGIQHLASQQVQILSIHDAKGLEFDSVLIIEPIDILAESPRGLNDLYVALTRATQRLGILYSKALPEYLASVIPDQL